MAGTDSTLTPTSTLLERRYGTLAAFLVSLVFHVFLLSIPLSKGGGASVPAQRLPSASELQIKKRSLHIHFRESSGESSNKLLSAMEFSDQSIAEEPISRPFDALQPPAPVPYVPVENLTTPPVLLQDVARRVSIAELDGAERKLVFRVRINEYGFIDEVLIESSEVSPEAAEVIRERYYGLRFSPGEIYGFVVRSELRIEVTVEEVQLSPILK